MLVLHEDGNIPMNFVNSKIRGSALGKQHDHSMLVNVLTQSL